MIKKSLFHFDCSVSVPKMDVDFDDLWENDLPEPPPPGPSENTGFEGPSGRFFTPPSLPLEAEGPQQWSASISKNSKQKRN